MTNHLEDVKTMDERGHTKNFDESADDKDHDPSQDIIKREIASDQDVPVLDRDCDPLDWWRERKSKYPNLVPLVRCVSIQFIEV